MSDELRLSPSGDGVARLDGLGEHPAHPEAVRARLDRAWTDDPALHRIETSVDASDDRTRRVLHRAGFLFEGLRRSGAAIARNVRVDQAVYAVLRGEHSPTAAVLNTVLPRTRLIAHVLFGDGHGRHLLCATTFKSDWELPGGVVERHESPKRAAEREVEEEIGLDVVVGDLLAVDWLPPYRGWDDALELIFDGGVLTPEQCAAMRLDGTEIAEVFWCTPEEAYDRLRPGAADRLRHLVATGVLDGRTPPPYLENGVRPQG